MTLFEKFGLNEELLNAIKRLGYTKPTLIQERSIPLIIEGKDLIGESATGSGKTLAFGCSVVKRVTHGNGLQAIILAPSRELVNQIKESLDRISYYKKMNIITVYGGVSINNQINDLPKADVVIGTPGRLLDHIKRSTIHLKRINLLVLDEADRMFDMGFITDVERIIQSCPTKRQTLLFSATMSEQVIRIADRYMIKPIKVSAEKMVDPAKLKQVYYDIPRNLKLSLLNHLLENEKADLVMVFCNTRRTTDFVVKNLKASRIKALAIHGGLSQNKRNRTMDLFSDAKVQVLVCTDVASRGLHIDDISHIYNYDIPKEPKDYVHRIGRTARAGEEGKVINLLCDFDYDNFNRIFKEYPEFIIEKMERPYLKKIVAIGPTQRPQHQRFHRRRY
ncbi:MAG: DEAD/DEAH box helicase [Nanoarchaeota archaeon]